MKYILLFFIGLQLAFLQTDHAFAQVAPDFAWVKGGGNQGNDVAVDIAVDANGNSYVTGYFEDSITFESTTLYSNGIFDDIFLVKYDPAGGLIWARRGGAPSSADFVRDLSLDQAGNVYLVGQFANTATFGNLSITANSTSPDVFMVKYDPTGNAVMAKKFGGSAYENGYSVHADDQGNIYVAGSFRNGTAVIGSNSYFISVGDDGFLAKLDPAGNVVWSTRIGNLQTGPHRIYGMDTDGAGNVYISGSFHFKAKFGNITLNSAGGYNTFLAKYDPAGNALWVKKAESGEAFDLAVDPSGNCYVTGVIHDELYVENMILHALVGVDIFILKYNASGNLVWAKQAGGDGPINDGDIGYGIVLDNAGHFYLSGCFVGTAVFNNSVLRSDGYDDIFVAKYDINGNPLWARQAGGPKYTDAAFGVAVDANGNSFICGGFSEFADFNGKYLNGHAFTSVSARSDVFIAKLGNVPAASCVSPGVTISGTCSGSSQDVTFNLTGQQPWKVYYTKNGIGGVIYTNTSPKTVTLPSGDYTLTGVASGSCYTPASGWFVPAPQVTGNSGCPGNHILSASGGSTGATYRWYTNATITTPISGATGATFVTPYLNATTTYYVAIVNAGGCIVGPRAAVTATVSPFPNTIAGGSHTVCADAAPFTLSGHSPAGGTWSGTGVSASGVFTPNASLAGTNLLTYTVTNGTCTQAATSTVMVVPVPATPNIVLISPDTLMSSVSGSSYAWKQNGTVLPVASKKLQVVASGNYAVSVKNSNNCTSAYSPDYNFVISGLNEQLANEVELYPNPTSGIVNLKLKEGDSAQLKVLNTIGEIILIKHIEKADSKNVIPLDLTGFTKGIYIIKVKTDKQVMTKKIVVE